MAIKPAVETLPSTLEKLKEVWRQKLNEILKQSKSPAEYEDVKASLEADQDFMSLVNGWELMPTAAQANAMNKIEERLWEAAVRSREFCVRCGQCCRNGSPILYEQDRPILAKGIIQRSDLVTLRAGEVAYSNKERKMVILAREQIKVKSVPDSRQCIYLSPMGEACLIYSDRLHQCRIMDCWDPSRFEKLLSLPPVSRLDLLGMDNPISQLIEKHDEKTSIIGFAKAISKIVESDPASGDEAVDMILFDLHVRQFAIDKLNIMADELDFFFGRRLAEISRGFGYEFQADENGKPVLISVNAEDGTN